MEWTMSRDYAKVIAKAWIDPSFKARLMQDPAAVLSEHGITLPEGMDFNNFMLPHAPVEQVGEMNLGIYNCPAPVSIECEAVVACSALGLMDLVHEPSLGVIACPAATEFTNMAVVACGAEERFAPADLIHDQNLAVHTCPAE